MTCQTCQKGVNVVVVDVLVEAVVVVEAASVEVETADVVELKTMTKPGYKNPFKLFCRLAMFQKAPTS